MARLNDPPQPGLESLEAVKKRYIRQNREIARINSTQSIRIRSLETETTRLLSENIELREQVIKLQASLDRRERTRVVVENVEATKTQLEGKVAEMQELLRSLGQALSFSPQAKSQQKRKSFMPQEQRTWKSGLSFSEVMGTENSLPAISEDARSRRSSLNIEDRRTSLNGNESRRSSLNTDENRRSSINFEEITLLPPRPDNAESDEDLKPPVSSMLDIRPRRRRDSAVPVDLESSRPTAPHKAQPQTTTVDSSTTKLKKRRYEDRDQAHDIESLNLDFEFTKLSRRMAGMAEQQTDIQKPIVSVVTLDEPEEDPTELNEDELNEIEKIVEAGKRAAWLDCVEKESVPTKETVTPSATSTMGRRALGPKSTNSDPSNSPLKQAAIKANLSKERDLEKPEKSELPPPKMKAYREPNIMDIPLLDTELAAGTGRPSRRSRAGVNYALPNLRDKMRRDDKPGEPVKGEGKAYRRSTTGGRLKNKEDAEEFIIKKEDDGNCEGVENQWFDLPILPHATTMAVDVVEEPRKPKETGIGGLLGDISGREKDGEQGLPTSVMTHRKRRASNLHHGALMDLGHNGTEGRSQIAVPVGPGRKTVSFDPASTNGGREAQLRNRTEGTSMRRKGSVHSHLPPSSSQVDVVGEASLALNEIVRGSRRITLGGAGKGIRHVKSINNMGGEETGVEDNIPTIALGMASRRRSMVL